MLYALIISVLLPSGQVQQSAQFNDYTFKTCQQAGEVAIHGLSSATFECSPLLGMAEEG